MKKIRRSIFCIFLSLGLFLSSCSRVKKAERELYRSVVLSDIFTKDRSLTLSGMAEDVCLIDGSENFDETLSKANYCGLFAEDKKEVLYEKNALKKIFPASLTKMMTALLTVENCPDLTEKVTVTEEALAGLEEGDSMADLALGGSYTVEDLLYALIVPSGNDAANVLAIHISGSIEDFTALMNERAAELCMVNTHFANPHGLHAKNHYTTVYDLYLLVRECMKYDIIRRAASADQAAVTCSVEDGTTEIQEYLSGNSYLRGFTLLPEGLSIVLSKTGYTAKAGRCLILAVQDEKGENYIAVICGIDTYNGLYEEMNGLLSMIGE